ncbi:MAG TPA: ParB/RepB/Spo0J family partition protein [Firmicutes bacterium]|nr:ParB/RepB/Spo0J family partition protein [Bacillota bacterium]
MPLDVLGDNPYQPRWETGDVEELSSSIREHGVLQPLVVRKVGGTYQVVAGERRLRAARAAGLRTVPAVVAQCDEAEAAILSLVENLQRQDLSAVEEAESYRRILAEFHLTQEELARRLGLSQSTVANRLRLLKLPEEVRQALHTGCITERHGRALLRLEDENQVREAFQLIISGGLRVQEAEALVERMLGGEDGGGGEEAGKKRRMRLGALRDLRIFLNTFRGAVETLRRAGVPAWMEEDDRGDQLVVIVRIERPQVRRSEKVRAEQRPVQRTGERVE